MGRWPTKGMRRMPGVVSSTRQQRVLGHGIQRQSSMLLECIAYFIAENYEF